MLTQKKDILVIDDDIDTLVFIKKILANAGHNVIHAMNIKDALESMQSFAPHLLLVDFKLLGESGLEITKKLRSESKYDKIPIIMISSSSDKKVVMTCISAGANEFIAKPLTSNKLIQRVKKLLKQSELPEVIYDIEQSVRVKTYGELIKINETACILQSSTKIPKDEQITVHSDFLDELGANPCRLVSLKTKVANPGLYRTELSFQGIDEKTATKIRQIKIVD